MNINSFGLKLAVGAALVFGMGITPLRADLAPASQSYWIVQTDSASSARHWVELVGGETVREMEATNRVAAYLSDAEADVLSDIPGVSLHFE